jgi:protoheme IX farnesyltransferase
MSMASDSIPNDGAFSASTAHAPGVSMGSAGDYFELLKPRVMSLVIFTALTGMMLAPGHVNPILGFASLLAIAVGAGASGCLNMWWDADIDAVMQRTARRPIPSGRITPSEALAFGMTLSFGSVLFLGVVSNWVAAALLAFTIFFYVVVYSMWLKRWTAQNIVIGGAAGAFPPMVGYAAATGTVTFETAILFGIIFIWTPPHFWALALVKSQDYARAGVPMLPVVAGEDETRRQILIYTVILAPFGILPWVFGFAGLAYLVTAGLGGLMMLGLAIRIYRLRDGEPAKRACMQMFGYSILYLFLLFAVLLGERVIGDMSWTALAAWLVR